MLGGIYGGQRNDGGAVNVLMPPALPLSQRASQEKCAGFVFRTSFFGRRIEILILHRLKSAHW